jgi:hypothetical protein
MDIAGAKALKQRLGPKSADHVPPVPVDVPEDAPPLYQWLGLSRVDDAGTTAEAEDPETPAQGPSLFRRLGFGSR